MVKPTISFEETFSPKVNSSRLSYLIKSSTTWKCQYICEVHVTIYLYDSIDIFI